MNAPLHVSSRLPPVLALIAALLAGCATPPAVVPARASITAMPLAGAAQPPEAAWVRTELYFATGHFGAPDASAGQWRSFLDREVTPRFRDGFTVFDGYGQWLARGKAGPERLRSKVLLILHEDTPARHADIEAIRVAWKRAGGAQSVLRSSQPAEVSFYSSLRNNVAAN